MKNHCLIIQQSCIWIGLLMLIPFISCKDNWDEHYAEPAYTENGTIFEVLSKNSEYQSFINLINQTNCDTLINSKSQLTVFAFNNTVASQLSSREIADLKAILQMHIAPSAIYPSGINGKNVPAFSGKLLKFRGSNGNTVNGVSFNATPIKTRNGLIYQIEGFIESLPNLFDVINTNPDLSLFKKLIEESYISIPDSVNNILLGYDSLNVPIYEEPILYINHSEFLSTLQPDNEQVISTAFLPSDAFIRQAVSKILVEKGGHAELIVPRFEYPGSEVHRFPRDTTLADGTRYFQAKEIYEGDTVTLMRKIFSHIFTRTEVPSLTGSHTFTDILGNPLSIFSGQVKSGANTASNGYYYIMNEVTVPKLFYRNDFWLLPSVLVSRETNASGTLVDTYTPNPNITYFDNANPTFSMVGQALCYTKRFVRYDCRKTGAGINCKWPYVTPGKYKVLYSYYSENNQLGIFNISYGDQMLAKDFNQGGYNNNRHLLYVEADLGTIEVSTEGSVTITFTCSKNAEAINNGTDGYKLVVDYLRLQPVD